MNPFDLQGPEFLILYTALFALALGGVSLLRARRGDSLALPNSLDPYEAAYLAGGTARAVEAATAALFHRGVIEVDALEQRLRATGVPEEKLDPFEAAVLRRIPKDEPVEFDRLVRMADIDAAALHNRLVQQGLLRSNEEVTATRWGSALPFLLLMAVGLVKLVIGFQRERPVGFLICLLIATGAAAALYAAHAPKTSPRGEVMLRQLLRRSAALQANIRSAPDRVAARDLSLGVGLFGAGILMSGPLADFGTTARRPAGSATGDGGTGSTCGSGCGSGGGDGGGGGCGGGCGGCGGGCGAG